MQGITTHNPVFASGLVIAPAVFMSGTLSNALTYAAFFSSVTFTALLFSSFLPKRIPYALRIVLYAMCAAVVYIPFYIYFDGRLPSELAALGMFLPMTATSRFVVSASELRFFKMSRPQMMADIISHIIGLDIAIIFMGAFRELFSTGGINGELYGITHICSLIGAPCGGFIIIGLTGALIRKLRK